VVPDRAEQTRITAKSTKRGRTAKDTKGKSARDTKNLRMQGGTEEDRKTTKNAKSWGDGTEQNRTTAKDTKSGKSDGPRKIAKRERSTPRRSRVRN